MSYQDELDRIDKLIEAAKNHKKSLVQIVKLNDKVANMEIGKQNRKATADLNWKAKALRLSEHMVHVRAVEAGLALPEPERYGDKVMRWSNFHESLEHFAKPKGVK